MAYSNKLNNTVILSGDSHASWVNELTVDGENPTKGYVRILSLHTLDDPL